MRIAIFIRIIAILFVAILFASIFNSKNKNFFYEIRKKFEICIAKFFK